MANTKKYVSLDKLGLYDEKIKNVISTGDAAALDSAKQYAKDYADSLASNYEAAGSVETAKSELQGKIDAVEGKVTTAQNEVDALELLVGTLPTGTTATTVVEYINKKTEGIATDAALGELNSQVSSLQTAVQGIQADYLTSDDKTELSNLITGEANRADAAEKAIDEKVEAIKSDYLKGADKTALQGSIDGVAANVATISGDYLKGSDKTELQGKIDLKADQTALQAEIDRATGVEEGLQNQINLIMDNPETKDVIDSISEFTQYITDHGTIADGFRTDIDKNKGDIAAEVKRAGEAEAALSGRIDTLAAIDHEAYVGADTALKTELEGKINAKADASALTEAVQALEGADTGLGNRITVLEGKLGTGDGSVDSKIATAKQEAIDAAAGDATSKANAAETAAKGHADGLNTAMNARVEALEAIDHDHSNKGVLDGITADKVSGWDNAAGKVHEHSNLTVLEGITSAKVTAWDAAEGNAKGYADGLNTAMDTRVVALETWHTNFSECSEDDIKALFGEVAQG